MTLIMLTELLNSRPTRPTNPNADIREPDLYVYYGQIWLGSNHWALFVQAVLKNHIVLCVMAYVGFVEQLLYLP